MLWRHTLCGKFQNGVNDIVVIVFQSTNSLCTTNASLRNDQLNILGLHAGFVNFTSFFFRFRYSSRCCREMFSDTLGGSDAFWRLELFGGSKWGCLAQILSLGVAKNDVSITTRRLVHVGLVDDEK